MDWMLTEEEARIAWSKTPHGESISSGGDRQIAIAQARKLVECGQPFVKAVDDCEDYAIEDLMTWWNTLRKELGLE